MKKNLLKTLLVGTMVLASTSVWADNFTLSPTETTIIWGNGDGTNGPETLNENGDKNYYDASATEWVCSQVNISGGVLNNQNIAWGGSYAVITKFDESNTLAGMNIQKATLKFNSVCTIDGKNSNVIVASIGTDWDAATVTWNNMDRTATQLSAGSGTNVNTSQKTLTQDVTELLANDEDKIVAFAIYTYTAREQKITDIVLEVEAVDAASSAEVKLLYVDGQGNELKTATVVGSAGNTLTLTDEQKASFFVDGQKYIYVSDNSAEVTIASNGSSVITLTYREADVYNFTVNFTAGEINLGSKTGSSFEGEAVVVSYPKYLAADGQLYTRGASNKEYNYKFTPSADAEVKNLEYNSVNDVNDVVFITEGEDIEGLTVCTSPNTGVRSSNSSSAYATADTKVVTLGEGTYKLHTIIYDASKNPDSHWIFKAGETQIADFNCIAVNIQEFDSQEFTLTEETDIIFAAGGSNNMGLDALYITGNGKAVTTGISSVSAVAGQDAIFNLAGQQVKQAVKGVYVINGKKVVMK